MLGLGPRYSERMPFGCMSGRSHRQRRKVGKKLLSRHRRAASGPCFRITKENAARARSSCLASGTPADSCSNERGASLTISDRTCAIDFQSSRAVPTYALSSHRNTSSQASPGWARRHMSDGSSTIGAVSSKSSKPLMRLSGSPGLNASATAWLFLG